MSKLKLNTREKILDKALEMFNERGIEYVGLRELAGVLDIRVSNITYYFPTKDDLVYELSLQLREANSSLIKRTESITMKDFLDTMKSVFQNHIRFRCLLLSVVHLMKQNRHMAAEYRKTQRNRNQALRSNLQTLADSGYLSINEDADLDFLVSAISLISRFWISETSISFQAPDTGSQPGHYLYMISRLLIPYSTRKGKQHIEDFKKMNPV